ncbi:MAG: TetR/AcrR family transcriptional regulator [Saprospiraceae bacterium]|nr:TetR/AcrR family transcriptional regulator [Saprospiraceae bacterium]
MRPQKVEHKELMEGLLLVLRAKGYDGASLSDLASATGLKKASLYHRFPGGKKQMTEAVLEYVAEWVELNIFAVLINKQEPAPVRLKVALQNIDALYHRGKSICIFRALSTHSGLELFGEQIRGGMEKYIEAFTRLGVDLQMHKKEAHQAALQTLIDIQGALIVSKGLQQQELFGQTLGGIAKRYSAA